VWPSSDSTLRCTQAAPGAWELARSQSTDKGPAELAAEVVREKLYQVLYHQVPYGLDPLPDKHTVLLDGTHLIRLVRSQRGLRWGRARVCACVSARGCVLPVVNVCL
jgi:hypothetical protein